MICLHPIYLQPYKKRNDVTLLSRNVNLELPCGKCINCRINKADEWATRITLESTLYKKNAFVTLTYSEPRTDYSKDDIQKFLKRLRKSQDNKLRYYIVGECGEKYKRIHYHAIIFNYWPDDSKLFNAKKKYYGSQNLTKTWGHGHVLIAPVTPETINYVTLYMSKGVETQINSQGVLLERFSLMSRRPGLGRPAFDLNKYIDKPTMSIILNGRTRPIPSAFRRILNSYNSEATQIYKTTALAVSSVNALNDKLKITKLAYTDYRNLQIQKAVAKIQTIDIKTKIF